MKYAKLELLERAIEQLLLDMLDETHYEIRHTNARTLSELLTSYDYMRSIVESTDL